MVSDRHWHHIFITAHFLLGCKYSPPPQSHHCTVHTIHTSLPHPLAPSVAPQVGCPSGHRSQVTAHVIRPSTGLVPSPSADQSPALVRPSVSSFLKHKLGSGIFSGHRHFQLGRHPHNISRQGPQWLRLPPQHIQLNGSIYSHRLRGTQGPHHTRSIL